MQDAFSSLVFRACAAVALTLAAACATTAQKPAKRAVEPAMPTAPVYQLDDFLGARPDTIDAMLGAPTLTRREGAGEYRRYALSACTLIIILYPDETGAARAVHVDAAARHSSEEKPDLNACLAAG